MSFIFTNKFGIVHAKNFERFVTGTFANTYITFGKHTEWNANDTPTTPTDTSNTFFNFWNDLIGMKKITAADMNLVIPRVDWQANTVYVEYTQDTQLFLRANSANVTYDNSFYARNSRDQVFKCLFNNSSANSTVMPEINLGGQLPENPFVENSDGYKWKYMYTIPSGLKEKFFTNQYMPVTSEPIVTNFAVDGRLDIIKIINPGAGFNANANSNSLTILAVSGDGSNANITVKVASTAANGANIVGLNIISGGNNYTRAQFTLTDPLKIQNTANANLIAIIGPPGGHGSSVEEELGASSLMISVGFSGDEDGVFPVDVGDVDGFRQIGLIKDPLLANSAYATGATYRATTKYSLTQPNKDFEHGETVYVGSSLGTASFTASVEHYDDAAFSLYVTNMIGSFTVPASLVGANSGAIATILAVEDPSLKQYSGDLLYIDNRERIVRTPTETQQVKLVLRF